MVDVGNENSVFDILQANRDDFDNEISQSTTNEADIAAHYPYSPERLRIFVNGNRQFPEYGSVAAFEDIADGTLLKPQNSGDVVTLKTAERFRYVVQYVIEWSLSLQLNQTLQSGEIFAVGFGNPDLENTTDNTPGPNADGWIIYQNGSMSADEAVLAEYRAGTAVDTETVQLRNLFQIYGRLGATTNWYNVGPTTIEETLTEDGTQLNQTLGAVSADAAKGPENANKRITASIKAKGGAGSLQADIGSIGLRTLGDVEGIVRVKSIQFENLTVDTVGSFVPIAALRVDPDETIVSVKVSTLVPASYSASGDLKLVAFAVDPSKTDASSFATPNELSDSGSVIESTTNIEQMPDSSGTQTTDPSNPGGFQLGFGTLAAQRGKSVQGAGRINKRMIAADDIVVIAAFVPSGGNTGDLTFEIEVEEDW